MKRRQNNYKWQFLIQILFVFTLNMHSQTMGLDSCIDYAIKNNREFKQLRIEESISNENYKQSKRNLLPGLSAGAGANMFFGKSIDPTTNDFVDRKLFSSSFHLSSQITLFEGFTKNNIIKFNKINILRNHELINKKQMELTFAVMSKYYDVIYYYRLRDIIAKQVEVSKLEMKKTDKMIEVGKKAKSDIYEMQAQLASEQHNFLVVQNNYDKALLELKQIINYPALDTLNINNNINLSVDLLPSVTNIYEEALLTMPVVKNAELDIQAMQKKLAISRGYLSPLLTMGAGYRTNFADSNKERVYPNSATDKSMRTVSFANQIENNASQNIFISLSIPIFNRWSNRSNIKIAKFNLMKSKLRKEDIKDKLFIQIADDVREFYSLTKEIEQLKVQEKSMKTAYDIATKKFYQGLISTIEYYNSKNALAKASANLLRTKMQLKIKEKTLIMYKLGI